MNQQLQFVRAALAWDLIIKNSKNLNPLTYKELGGLLGIHHRVVRYPLDLIQKYCLKHGFPPLSILVVNQKGEIGQGFIQKGDLIHLKLDVIKFNWDKLENPFKGKLVIKKKFLRNLIDLNDKEILKSDLALQTADLPSYLFYNRLRIANQPDQFINLTSEKYNHKEYKSFEIITEFFKTFPEWKSNPIQRGDVIKLFKKDKKYLGFVAAMIWGGINASRPKESGNFETIDLYRLLSEKRSRIEEVIQNVENYLINDEVKECFQYLSNDGKIDGIGYPYFTKLMYFVGQANNEIKVKPLIFDKWTSNAYLAILINSNDFKKVNDFYTGRIDYENKLVGIRSQVSNVYFNYVTDMDKWAFQIGITPSKLEEFIFGTSLKINKTEYNPRNELWNIILKYQNSNES